MTVIYPEAREESRGKAEGEVKRRDYTIASFRCDSLLALGSGSSSLRQLSIPPARQNVQRESSADLQTQRDPDLLRHGLLVHNNIRRASSSSSPRHGRRIRPRHDLLLHNPRLVLSRRPRLLRGGIVLVPHLHGEEERERPQRDGGGGEEEEAELGEGDGGPDVVGGEEDGGDEEDAHLLDVLGDGGRPEGGALGGDELGSCGGGGDGHGRGGSHSVAGKCKGVGVGRWVRAKERSSRLQESKEEGKRKEGATVRGTGKED
ncbi:hypothetical protein DFP72DRAFT_443987 [Ephemerocybe angulata]|uniref:Uncharacterized protein n=1 Tax=Ephemerocybe angulata TaxID=980116 RepID=A0A8H6HU88_9AGAR|nr:hypothetical protein DFP72DRAFT_443987 [Tulosesus angulatus]